jgi:cytochrome c553
MVEHFVIASYARDAVITDHLGALRRALGALADYKYEHVAPGSWQPWIAKLQAAARPGAGAETLEEAARATASTAAVCGECHMASANGPHFTADYAADGDGGLSNTLSDRMERHVWAANRMWEGLIAPSDVAWRAGSNELASLPLKAPKEKPPLAPGFVRELRQLRELGDRARGATEPAERVQIYARLLTSCAQCHERETKTTF